MYCSSAKCCRSSWWHWSNQQYPGSCHWGQHDTRARKTFPRYTNTWRYPKPSIVNVNATILHYHRNEPWIHSQHPSHDCPIPSTYAGWFWTWPHSKCWWLSCTWGFSVGQWYYWTWPCVLSNGQVRDGDQFHRLHGAFAHFQRAHVQPACTIRQQGLEIFKRAKWIYISNNKINTPSNAVITSGWCAALA